MISKYKFKIICGFREDQEYTIDANELHKAYYLFNNPKNNRAIFSSGVAILGDDIRRIVPDFHATMGWNITHKLDGDDMNELHRAGVTGKMNKIMSAAKEVARIGDSADTQVPLLKLVRSKYERITNPSQYAKQVLQGATPRTR